MMEIFLITMDAHLLANQSLAMSAASVMDGFCHGSTTPARLYVVMVS